MKHIRHALLIGVFIASTNLVRAQSGGPIQRLSNTTLTNLPSQPPTFGFTSTNLTGSFLSGSSPVGIASPPGETNRMFIVEKPGVISVYSNLAAPLNLPPFFLNILDRVDPGSFEPNDERGVLGLAFHPGYASNGYFYVFYTGIATTPVPGGTNSLHDILSRFQTSTVNSNQADANSELRLIVQRDQAANHNAGDLHFGPDGYLYVSLGDEGGADGQFNNTQSITNDFFSGILRIDVDKRPGSLPPNPHPSSTTNYAVPPDNPFVGATNFNGFNINSNDVRTEFWAVGLRNPWRMSFDPMTGTLYCGDVGQFTREEINIIGKGANYGWNWWEGFSQRTNSAQLPAGFIHTPPLIDYPRSSGFAVTGGRVYRGQRLSQLYGAYVYGDYGSGRIWALRHTGTNVTENTLLFTDDRGGSPFVSGVSAFGTDPRDGELLYADQKVGRIKKIIYNATSSGSPLPPTLADTGAFADLTTLTPNAGIVAYEVNVPFWSDNAKKMRWFSVPDTNLTIAFNREGNWSFPTGMVWIKHFELELTNGVPESTRRLETRFLVNNSNGVYGVTYRWGDSLTNATLVPEGGLDESFTIVDGGILRTQVWHYPGRSECLSCHTAQGGWALGFNTPQLNRDFTYDGTTTNQILALSRAGYFNTNVTGSHTLRSLAPASDTSVSLEYRIRSYLEANCVQCHQPGGAALGLWDARIMTPTALANIINGTLLYAGGDSNNRVVRPGSLNNSMLLARISTRESIQMPPLDSTLIDTQAVQLLSAWITNDLPSYQTFADWQTTVFGSTNAPNAQAEDDPDGDGAKNHLEFLTQSNPTNSADAWKISVTQSNGIARVTFLQIANRGFQVECADSLPGIWQPLDVIGNEPTFSSTNKVIIVEDAIADSNKFYRVRVFEP